MKKLINAYLNIELRKRRDIEYTLFAVAFFTVGTMAVLGLGELLKAMAFAVRGY